MDSSVSDHGLTASPNADGSIQETVPSNWLGQLRRFASPSALLLALLLFPLPWVEIQCAGNPSNSRAKLLMQKQNVPDWVTDRLLSWGEERKTWTWLRQSGLQAALGSYSDLDRD